MLEPPVQAECGCFCHLLEMLQQVEPDHCYLTKLCCVRFIGDGIILPMYFSKQYFWRFPGSG